MYATRPTVMFGPGKLRAEDKRKRRSVTDRSRKDA